jgi:protoporphyrinogen oxidase
MSESVKNMTVDTEVFVIGAGPAGLTAAYCLTKDTPNVIVIEKDPVYVGGISRTVEHNGFLFDIGGHRFFSKSKEIVDLWDEILPFDFIERPRLSRIYYGGKYYSYPLNAFEALSNLGLIRSSACMLSFLYSKAFPIKDPKTFREWVCNQFGEKLFSIFFKTYTEKVWGMSCDEISADWASQRIKGLDLGVAVMNALKRVLPSGNAGTKKGEGGAVVKTLIENFRYPRRGPGMMWDAAARQVKARGGKVLMGRDMREIRFEPEQNRWRIAVADANGKVERFTARHVISSAPVRELVQKLQPQLRSLPNALNLRYRDFITVALMVDKPDLFPDNWIYIHDPSVKVGRVQNFRSWSPEMVPTGKTCLGLEYFCFEGDSLWTADDADLIALAKREIAKIGLISAEDVIDACVVRQEKAYPVYDETYRENVQAVRGELEKEYPNLHLVGRNGMHKYNNQDHAMMTAILTARNILSGERKFDIWEINEDAEYHEAGESGAADALRSERLVPRKVARASI